MIRPANQPDGPARRLPDDAMGTLFGGDLQTATAPEPRARITDPTPSHDAAEKYRQAMEKRRAAGKPTHRDKIVRAVHAKPGVDTHQLADLVELTVEQVDRRAKECEAVRMTRRRHRTERSLRWWPGSWSEGMVDTYCAERGWETGDR